MSDSYAEQFIPPIPLPGIGGLSLLLNEQFIADNELADAQNVVYNQGALSPRQGAYSFADKPDGETGIPHNLFKFRTSDAVDFMVGKYGNNYYVYDPENADSQPWIKINAAYAPTDDSPDGATVWNEKVRDDSAYGGNGLDNTWKWPIALTTVAIAAASGDSTITVTDGSRFPTSGTVIIQNGATLISKTITNVSGNVITISGTWGAAIAAGRGVTMGMIDKGGSFPKGKIYFIFNQRLFITGGYTSENVVAYSKTSDPDDFSTTSGITGAGTEVVADGNGPVLAAKSFGSFAVLVKKDAVLQWNFINNADLNAKLVTIVPVAEGVDIGPLTYFVTGSANNEMFFPTASNGIQRLEPVATGNTTSVKADKDFGNKILPVCTDFYSFLNSRTAYHDRMLLIAAGISKFSYLNVPNTVEVKNTDVLLYDFNFGAWTIFKGWQVRDFAVYNNSLMFLSNIDGSINQCFVGYEDYGGDYLAYAKGKRFDFSTGHMPKTNDKVFVCGTIKRGTTLHVDVNFYLPGTTLKQSFVIDSTDSRVIYPPIMPLGASKLGGAVPLGAGVEAGADEGDMGEFNFWLDVTAAAGFLSLQLEYYSNKAGSFWTVKEQAFNPQQEAAHPPEFDISPS